MEDTFRDELEEGSSGGSFDLKALVLYGAARYKAWIVLFAVLGAAGGIAFSLTKPNTYTSEAKLLVKFGVLEQRTVEETVEEGLRVYGTGTGIGDEIELLINPTVHERVAREVGATELLRPYDPRELDSPSTSAPIRWLHRLQAKWFRRGSPVDNPYFDPTSESAIQTAAAVVAGSTDLWNVGPRTNVIVISASAHSPELAQQITRTYVEVARLWHREVYGAEEERDFIETQLEEARSEAEKASKSFAEHRLTCGFYDIEAMRAALVDEIGGLTAQIENLQSQIASNETELELASTQLAETPRKEEKILPPITLQNPRYTALIQSLRDYTIALDDLSGTYKEGSTELLKGEQRLEKRIAATEKKLEEVDVILVAGGNQTELVPSPVHEELTKRKYELARDSRGLRVELEQREEVLERRRKRIEELLRCESTHKVLSETVAQSTYRASQLAEANAREQILSLIDSESTMGNIKRIQAAQPGVKTGPKRAKLLGMGLAAGLALGLALAVLLQLLDPRVRYPDALEKSLGVRLLVVVPEQRKWRRIGGRIRKQVLKGA